MTNSQVSSLVAGKFYRNFRADELGPMEEWTPDHWLDQYGVVYHADGTQWNHVKGSTGNIDLSTDTPSHPMTQGSPTTGELVARLRDDNDWLMRSRLHGHEIRALQTGNNILRAIDALTTLERELEAERVLSARLKLEAQGHASEARTANSIIYEIYQVLSGGRGEPGNWNGAEPARRYVAASQAEVERLKAELAQRDVDIAFLIGDSAEMAEEAGATRTDAEAFVWSEIFAKLKMRLASRAEVKRLTEALRLAGRNDAVAHVRGFVVGHDEFQVSEIDKGPHKQKAIYNAVTYLAGTGELVRLGYGRYRRAALHVEESKT